jgi:hypothetical protein
MRLEHLDPTWRTHQSRTLIVHKPESVARAAGYSLDWIYNLRNAVTPAAAITAFPLSRIQDDVRFLQDIATRNGYLLIARPLPDTRRSPIVLLGAFAAITSRVIETLIAKIHKGEKLTPDEATHAERMIDKGHTDLEALREEVRKNTAEQG